MKMKHFMVGVVVGLVVGLLIGNYLGVKQTQKLVDQIRAELLSNVQENDESRTVNMALALDQVRKVAQERGLELTSVKALGPRTVQLNIANGPAVSLQWRQMGVDSDASRRDLDRKIGNLMAVIKKAHEVHAPLNHVELTK
ncbi:MAG: hypothetical protein WCS52_09075 [bacterium]